MLKANDLRVGNLVNYGVNIVPIKSIHTESVLKNEVTVYVELNEKLQNYCLNIDEIEPIPLTEEWLIKMGFVFVNDNKRYGWYLEVSNNRCLFWCHSKEIQLEFIKDEIEYNNTLFDFKCEQVHTLQNLYYALCGEELTIKN